MAINFTGTTATGVSAGTSGDLYITLRDETVSNTGVGFDINTDFVTYSLEGALYAADGEFAVGDAIRLTEATAFRLFVGEEGYLFGNEDGLDALTIGQEIDFVDVLNQGTMIGERETAIELSPNVARASIENTGLMHGGVDGIFSFANLVRIVNKGEILGRTGRGLELGAENAVVFNEGNIGGATHGIRLREGGRFSLTNTGEIFGTEGVDSSAPAVISNSGLIASTDGSIAIDLSDMEDRVTNRGQLNGDVYLNRGNDTFNGVGGIVNGTVFGGLGNDTYIVDDPGLALVEASGEGNDTVRSFVSWTLGDNFERLELTGADDIDGTGTQTAETIIGNDADNLIVGLGGDDTLTGLRGDDRVFGGGGEDVLQGSFGDDLVNGGGSDDAINGGAGDDVIIGGAGGDNLTGDPGGGGGRDTFVYFSADESTTASFDRILDFISNEDVLDLRRVDADSTTLGKQDFNFIGTDPFTSTPGELRVFYGATVTRLDGDTDGNGGADFRIFFNNGEDIAASDILL